MTSKRILLIAAAIFTVIGCREGAAVSTPQVTAEAVVVETPTSNVEPTPVPSATAEFHFVPTFSTEACPFAIPGEVEVDCGRLTVPENHDNPGNGRTITLPVAIFKSLNSSPAVDPMIYLAGGPGADVLETIPYNFERVFAPYLVDRDLILFDQRGTGYSEPSLDCPEYKEAVLGSIGEKLSNEETVQLTLAALDACHDRLTATEVDFSRYNSAQSAADVAMLQQTLGYEWVNVYGASYGTRLAQTVMRDFPEGIRSVILDSTYPIAANLQSETPHHVKRAMNLFFAACEADAACSAAYPDFANTFWTWVATLDESPLRVEVQDAFTGERYHMYLDGEDVVAQLFQSLYNAELISLFPQLVHSAKNGDTSLLSAYLSNSLAKLDFVSLAMMFSVQCREEIAFSDPAEVAEAAAAYPELESFFANSIALGMLGLPVCESWGVGEVDPLENLPIKSDIPTLILQGEYDPITPPAWGEMVGGGLSRHYYYTYAGQGHGPGLAHACPRQMALAFLQSPTAPPDDSCMGEMATTFVTPVDTTVVSLTPVTIAEFGIVVHLPQNWLEVSAEYRVAPDRSVELVVKEKWDESLDDFLSRWNGSEVQATIHANDMAWEIRQISVGGDAQGYVATAPSARGYYLVLLVTTPEQAASLYDPVFVPIVESVTIDVES